MGVGLFPHIRATPCHFIAAVGSSNSRRHLSFSFFASLFCFPLFCLSSFSPRFIFFFSCSSRRYDERGILTVFFQNFSLHCGSRRQTIGGKERAPGAVIERAWSAPLSRWKRDSSNWTPLLMKPRARNEQEQQRRDCFCSSISSSVLIYVTSGWRMSSRRMVVSNLTPIIVQRTVCVSCCRLPSHRLSPKSKNSVFLADG